jgi:hypothetical protein
MGKIYWTEWASLCGIAHTPAGLKCTSNQSIRSGPLPKFQAHRASRLSDTIP